MSRYNDIIWAKFPDHFRIPLISKTSEINANCLGFGASLEIYVALRMFCHFELM